MPAADEAFVGLQAARKTAIAVQRSKGNEVTLGCAIVRD
jgi:hypothetical protein